MSSSDAKVVIVPGNGCGDVENANWYAWLRDQLLKEGIQVILRSMPDPEVARESIWIPFMHKEMGCDEKTVIVGHSSGAVAANRYAEKYKVHGIVVVSPCVTHLGDENERASGYYSRPWEWQSIKENTNCIAIFGSDTDPFIPLREIQEVVDNLQPDETHIIPHRGHFMERTFPELLDVVRKFLQTV
ncbi:serine hydrolase RBBP9-like [Diadema antillarum]|uniref:serine hydrolase RBBP9-like n=1 Tax=Diadema antillarum TaxID=105358 RepID=UPI003A85D1AA